MGQLHHHGGLDNLVVDFAVHGCREQGQQRAHALASGQKQVAGGDVCQVVGLRDGLAQALLNTGEGREDLRTQLGVCGDQFEARGKLQIEVSQQVGGGDGLLCVGHGVFYLLGVF